MRLLDDERAVLVYQMLTRQRGAERLVRELYERRNWVSLKQLVQFFSSRGLWNQGDVDSLIKTSIPSLNEHTFTALRGGGQGVDAIEMRMTDFGRRIHELWAKGAIPASNLVGGSPEFYDPEEAERTGHHPTERILLERLARSSDFMEFIPELLSVPLMNESLSNVFTGITISAWVEEGIVEVREGGKLIRLTKHGHQLLDEIHRLNT